MLPQFQATALAWVLAVGGGGLGGGGGGGAGGGVVFPLPRPKNRTPAACSFSFFIPVSPYNLNMPASLSVAILAGGRSSRMGTDKAFVRVLGRPLIEDILAQVAGLGDETLIVTNRPDDYAYLGVPLFGDVLPDKGALGACIPRCTRPRGGTSCALPAICRLSCARCWITSSA